LTSDRKKHLKAHDYRDEEDLEGRQDQGEQQAVPEGLPVWKGQGKERVHLGIQSPGPIRQ
jgi:hypothetical protein